MRDVAKTIKRHLNEASGIKLTENDLVDLAVKFIMGEPYNITFTEKDLIRYIKKLPGFELFSMRGRNYGNQGVIDAAADEQSELNAELKDRILDKLS
jgi:hypothetical protein